MDFETCSLYTCIVACEMNVGAVCLARQDPKLSVYDHRKRSHAMFATEQRWCGVDTANEKRRTSISRERTDVRDILTNEHRPRKTHRKCCRNRINQRMERKSFSVDRFFLYTQFRMREQQAVQKTLATIQQCAPDETRF